MPVLLQVLVNPNSGRKNAAIVWRSVEHLFEAAGVARDVRESGHANHLCAPRPPSMPLFSCVECHCFRVLNATVFVC